MQRTWPFSRKLAAGFSVIVSIAIAIAVIAIYALITTVSSHERVLGTYASNLVKAAKLNTVIVDRMAANRAFLLTKSDAFLNEIQKSRADSAALIAAIRSSGLDAESESLLAEVEQADVLQLSATDRGLEAARGDTPLDALIGQFESDVMPRNAELRGAVERFETKQGELLTEARKEASDAATAAEWLMSTMAMSGVLLAGLLAVLLSRTLTKQVGSAAQHIQNSSSELQAAANQQTSSSKEQVAAMNEISTTVKELVLTAKQIAESAQRVAQIASESGAAALAGDATVRKAQEGVVVIQRQVETIVTHMLDLGKKSQQIGGIVEIINELADQTNILAINATIEAAGAGDAGKRFSAVADEIRSLADRVGGSTREIRSLIEQVRSAVHTTVMATESGSKAAEGGTRQFGDVAAVFQQITELLSTTTEAAREIELSTKQQTTAVEQVNIAVANVSQAAKESEASSSQVLQTVRELTSLSSDLTQLIQAERAA